jgi:hypothetical protein
MTGAAVLEELDHGPGAGPDRLPGRAGGVGRGGDAFLAEHGPEGQAGESGRRPVEPAPAAQLTEQ